MRFNLQDLINTKVLVLGDCMLDKYWYGATERISPEAPVPIVKVNEFEERPGGAANVALNIMSLGGKVVLAGLKGDDKEGNILQQKLNAANVHSIFKTVKDKPTITKLRILSLYQQLIRLDFEQIFSPYDASELHEKIKPLIADHKILIFSDYAKGTVSDVTQLITTAKQNNIPVLVDPKGIDFKRYKGATLITPNLKEFQAVVGNCDSEEQIVIKGQNLIRELDLKGMLITRGNHGMTLLSEDLTEIHLPAKAREVYDVTGAGDTVIAVLGLALASGADLFKATTLANLAAGLVVQKSGAASLNLAELQNAVYELKASRKGVMTQEQLAIVVADAKLHGKKIIFTNGCFDILHPGHIEYLRLAKKLGHKLIVAVNDDQSVKRLKGESRPVNSLAKRMAVLAALESVDWVVDFSEDTPEELIRKLNPDVLVKGGDYKTITEIVGSDWVLQKGGEVKILPFLDGHSTTSVINKIKCEELL
ncbi:MAG: bifunctional D-glycero-beta-D-manno-heptose-7-phosphate kinase/D-glycero-beta-D-manno-heptose 1-phosphate adenylyltransferase HldE [Pseudomonadota bacterium]